MLRGRVFTHLENLFPKLADIPKHYGSVEFFKTEYGLNPDGDYISADRKPTREDDSAEEEEEGSAPNTQVQDDTSLTTYNSRRLLTKFCKGLAKHTYERSFLSMAKENKSFGRNLDLRSPATSTIAKHTREIEQTYADDFTAPFQAPPCNKDVVIHNNNLEVQVATTMLDEASYKVKLAEYNEAVAEYTDRKLDNFAHSCAADRG